MTENPGLPYDLLARTAGYRWWRPLLGLVLFAALGLIALVLATTLAQYLALLVDGRTAGDALTLLADESAVRAATEANPGMTELSLFLPLAAVLPAALLAARLSRSGPLGSVGGRLRWSWLGECLATALLLWIVAQVAVVLLSPVPEGQEAAEFPGWPAFGAVAAIAVLVVPLQCAAEEYVFRGLLLRTLSSWFRLPWVGILVTSAGFLSLHGYTDPIAWAFLVTLAIAGCWLTIRTGGLEAVIAMHVMNNSLAVLASGLGGDSDFEQAGEVPPGSVLPIVLAILGYAWWIDRRAARRELATTPDGRVPVTALGLRPPDWAGARHDRLPARRP
ncbi:CPBP family intramembrane metalloprotease domain-containing protein [Amycolatopsis antarctica]|uniref:CPBP family intramembrane metalloprotease domain-containing protein n=1 Tax=Amycolatopsis antarctica TaxID=1854586 RepID=A0A263D5G7_9PSEU|nr:CPBP family intramembrane glutamic endopeptidase [Amycolatopsis antarctica]OZM73621.1 CPBP family intramembrane metalloprotease domain-containing protein [Amycolatopsis antarctica]